MPRFTVPSPHAALTVVCCTLALAGLPALAQTPAEEAYEQAGWTGKLQDPAIARKEAGAALAEGRRECARQREDKAGCLKKVQADYAAAMKRLQKR